MCLWTVAGFFVRLSVPIPLEILRKHHRPKRRRKASTLPAWSIRHDQYYTGPGAPPRIAHVRGMQLLWENLSTAQRKSFADKRYFDVRGGQTGTRYRLTARMRAFNIVTVDGLGRGRKHICFGLKRGEDNCWPYVTGDQLLAQKICLEVDELATLRIANSERLGSSRTFQHIFGVKPHA